MPTTNDSRLLVTGASGQLGRLAIHHLLHTLKVEPSRIVAGSRNPDQLKDLANLGVLTRHIDFTDIASVEAAAQDVDRVLFISLDHLILRVENQKNAIKAFEAAGVKHILYTSFQNADASLCLLADPHRQTEQAIRESKIPGHTMLRNGQYFDNVPLYLAVARHVGQWPSAAKDGKLAAISRDDLARAAAYALASDSTGSNVHELTGSEALTIDETVAQISKVIEQPLVVTQVSVKDLAMSMTAATGLPAAAAMIFASSDTNVAAGLAGNVTDHYKQLTGVDPQTHEEWLAANKVVLMAL